MAGGREIKGKIKSIQNTRKVTRALEMVSAAKIRKAQERMKVSRPYAQAMRQVIGHLAQANTDYPHPFLVGREEVKRVGYIVGAFNLIFRTDDGGQHWTPLLELTDNPGALNLYAMRPVGDELFIVGEQGLVMKLDRASGRFNALPMPYNGSFFGVTGKPGVVLVFGLRGNVFRSTDDGISWKKIDLGLPLSISASSVTADGRIVLVSQAGHVLVSTDDGASFQQQPNTALAPVAAAQVANGGSLVLAGTRGLRQLPLE